MKVEPVVRRKAISRPAFVRNHLAGIGEPLILSGYADAWPARSKWTFDHLEANYGKDFGLVPTRFDGGGIASKLTTLKAYIETLDLPFSEMPGFWVDRDGQPLEAPASLDPGEFWNMNWAGFARHPELMDDIAPFPSAIPNHVLNLERDTARTLEKTSNREFFSIYISRPDTITPLHTDHSGTHGCLAQIQGSKKVFLFSPSCERFFAGEKESPEEMDFGMIAADGKDAARSCTLKPGDLLFIPSNWLHYVRSLTKSITISHNFFNDSNISEYLSSVISDSKKAQRSAG
jgi:Cupin-like domain